MEGSRSDFRTLTSIPIEGEKRHLGMHWHRWKHNIKIALNQSSACDLILRQAVAVMHSGQ